MSSDIRKVYGLTSAIILIGAMAGCATAPGDAEETAKVQGRLAQHAELGVPNSIDVQTVDHVVYLNGLVSQGMEGREAESVARGTPGVKQVVNLLAVPH